MPFPRATKKAAEAEAIRLAEEARIAEQVRLEEEARLAEETRLAEEEEARIKCSPKDMENPDERLVDLMKWLNSIPLSQKCFKRLDRDFSDGVLVSEIIAHYLPEICSAKMFDKCYSSKNKIINWEYMNRKVFPELGFRLKTAMIHNLMRPWDCKSRKYDKTCPNELAIYKILFKLQDALGRITCDVYDYRSEPEPETTEVTTEVSCKKEKVVKKQSRPQTFGKSMYSKIELQVANGYYDKKSDPVDDIYLNDPLIVFGEVERSWTAPCQYYCIDLCNP